MKKPKNFEEGMENLQNLLDQLADPDTPLDKAIKIYSDTAGLIEYCTSALEKAKLEMEQIDLRLEEETKQIAGNDVSNSDEEDILA